MSAHPIAAGKSSFDLVDADRVFAALDLQPGAVLLDLACGVGRYTLAAAERSPQTVIEAVDLWEEGIALLRAEAERRRFGNIRPLLADASRPLPFADASIDVCLLATVLHDLKVEGKAEAALREVARLLKPGGRFVVVEFNKIDGPPGPPQAIRLAPEETAALVAPFGFRLERQLEVGPYNYLQVFIRNGMG